MGRSVRLLTWVVSLRLCACVVVLLGVAGCSQRVSTAPTALTELTAPTAPMAVIDGRLTNRESGEVFRPKGFNYIRLDTAGMGSHATFSPFLYDGAVIEQMFSSLDRGGYNTVRVFINGSRGKRGNMTDSPEEGRLSARYLDNLTDFLQRARSHRIMVILCFEGIAYGPVYPSSRMKPAEGLEGHSAVLLDKSRQEAKRSWIVDVIREVRKRDAESLRTVLCWELDNESSFHLAGKPFSQDQGMVTMVNGKTYDLARDKSALADDMAVYWTDFIATGIRQELPGALISVNVFTYAAVGRSGPGDFKQSQAAWQNRYPFRPTALLRSSADIIDIHLYPKDEADLQRNLDSSEFSRLRRDIPGNKALMVGEFGIHVKDIPDLDLANAWMRTLVGRIDELGFQGWLYWTYDSQEQGELWSAMQGNGLIFNGLRQSAEKGSTP
jgi:hypothetical protein